MNESSWFESSSQIPFKFKSKTQFQLLFKIPRDLDQVSITNVAPNLLFYPQNFFFIFSDTSSYFPGFNLIL
jgi:hypothetical protein